MVHLAASSALVAVLCGAFVTARKCQNITVPVSISAQNFVFNVDTPQSNIDTTNLLLNALQIGTSDSKPMVKGFANISGTYNLATTYCTPDKGASPVVQVLTHGGGFTRSYWDAAYNGYNYSYVSEAVDQYGFTTLSWDTLGLGMSEHLDPLNEIQKALEAAALGALTNMLRAGSISGITSKPKKIILVGHSLGSILTDAVTTSHPDIADAMVLTGFSRNDTYRPNIVLFANYVLANTIPALAQYPDGFVANGDLNAAQVNFFGPDNFDPKILSFAYDIAAPIAAGELLSFVGPSNMMNNFTGPVLIVTGNRDLPNCGGNCVATGDPAVPNIPAAAKGTFPKTSAFQATVIPRTGHGLNLEYSAAETYGTMLKFLVKHGLGPTTSRHR